MSQSQPIPFQIKICGLTQPQQAVDAREAGADAIGLNFFEPSIRYVTANQAVAIAQAARQVLPTNNPAPLLVVGVFVNHTIDQIRQLANTVNLDGIQLHGDETVEFFVELKNAIAQNSEPTQPTPFFVRAIRTQPKGGSTQPAADAESETKRVINEIEAWSAAGIDTVLLDAAATGEFGGTGKSIDWSLMPHLQSASQRPLALAGGLTATNVAKAIKTAQVKIVDVASGVESPKGTKCPDQVKQFVQQARTALNR